MQDIEDKNKVDLLLRLISNAQTIWFCVTVIARGAEGLVVTRMELTATAFIFCSSATSFCWWTKGADVAVSVKLDTASTMAQIVKDAGDAAAGPYRCTPLDFISREEWHWSLYWTHWINILRVMHINFAPRALPHDKLETTIWLNMTARYATPAFAVMCLLYTAIFVAAWKAYFPTHAEQIMWRISSLSLIATVILYYVITALCVGSLPRPSPILSPPSNFKARGITAIIIVPERRRASTNTAAPNTSFQASETSLEALNYRSRI